MFKITMLRMIVQGHSILKLFQLNMISCKGTCFSKVFLKNTLLILQNKNCAKCFSKVPCIYFKFFLKNTYEQNYFIRAYSQTSKFKIHEVDTKVQHFTL